MYRPNVKAYVQNLDWSHSAVGRDNIRFFLKLPDFQKASWYWSSCAQSFHDEDTFSGGFLFKKVFSWCAQVRRWFKNCSN
jgi:hypothetical protein